MSERGVSRTGREAPARASAPSQAPAWCHRPRLRGRGTDAEHRRRDRYRTQRAIRSAVWDWKFNLPRRDLQERLSRRIRRAAPHRASDVPYVLARFIKRFPAYARRRSREKRVDPLRGGSNRREYAARRGADHMMQYRHLHYFVSVVEAGSFSRAASTIHIAQPALSQQIAQLEKQLGVSLLLRSARGVRPTAAGEVLYREASSILKRLQQLPGILRSSTKAAEGVVRLGMSSTVMTTVPMAFVEQCKASLPNVAVRMAVSDSPTIKQRVIAHELDLGLVLEDELTPTVARTPLFKQRLFLVRHRAASRGKPVRLAELAS